MYTVCIFFFSIIIIKLMFITFEGIDGSGKTTQSKLLANHFKQIRGENNVVLTREPGGTNFAEKVRGVLLTNNIDSISELLLLISMRREHMKKLILPALAEGKIVICDRFIDSTIAYQGYGFGVDLGLIRDLHKLVEIKYPDITFILDIDESYSSYAANSLINLFNQNLSYVKGKTIAAYIPMDEEIDVVPLMHSLLDLDYKVAIPNKNKLLKFEEWNKTNEDVIPDTIITPVIAFDDHFNRLGFGGGWYDTCLLYTSRCV